MPPTDPMTPQLNPDADYHAVKVLHPDWLATGIESKIGTLKLIQEGTWPESIRGAALVTTALWLLRCVYGSDLESAAALRKICLGKVQQDQEWERHFARWHPGGCNDPGCFICYDPEAAIERALRPE